MFLLDYKDMVPEDQEEEIEAYMKETLMIIIGTLDGLFLMTKVKFSMPSMKKSATRT